MKCRFCKRELTIATYRTKEYRDDSGSVYKTRRSPTYQKCDCRLCKHEWSVDEQGTRRCIGCGEPR